MTEGGFYQQKRMSPTGMAIVVLLHGAAHHRLDDGEDGDAGQARSSRWTSHRSQYRRHRRRRNRCRRRPSSVPATHTHDDRSADARSTRRSADSLTISAARRPPPPIRAVTGEQPSRRSAPTSRRSREVRAGTGACQSRLLRLERRLSRHGARAMASRGRPASASRSAPDGRVTDCTSSASSGSSALDATTCRLMKSRARFTPARDANGNPTTDSVANAIRWVLPAG